MTKYALIGGTGLSQLPGLRVTAEHDCETPYGILTQPVFEGLYEGHELLFLPRHGIPHRIAPHNVNYRANLVALKQLGVERIISVNAVGAINPALSNGQLLIPDQIIDYTWGREHTLYGDADSNEILEFSLKHIDMTQPYDESLRKALIDAGESQALGCYAGGTYAATQGPRLETAAEIKKLAADGCDMVGMTGMPEASLARELDMAYASICVAVNPAAGLCDQPITMDMIQANLNDGVVTLSNLLAAFFRGQMQ